MLDRRIFLFGFVDMNDGSVTERINELTNIQNLSIQVAYEKYISGLLFPISFTSLQVDFAQSSLLSYYLLPLMVYFCPAFPLWLNRLSVNTKIEELMRTNLVSFISLFSTSLTWFQFFIHTHISISIYI